MIYYVKHEAFCCLTRLLRVYMRPHTSIEENNGVGEVLLSMGKHRLKGGRSFVCCMNQAVLRL